MKNKIIKCIVTCLIFCGTSMYATAGLIQFKYTELAGREISWQIDPIIQTPEIINFGFSFKNVDVYIDGSLNNIMAVDYYTLENGGGFALTIATPFIGIDAYGAQLFTGTFSQPEFIMFEDLEMYDDEFATTLLGKLSITAVPEPSTLVIFALGLIGLVLRGLKRA